MITRRVMFFFLAIGFLIVLAVLSKQIFDPGLSERPPYVRSPDESAEVEIAKGLRMKFCWIPAGEAQLGSTKQEWQEENQEMQEVQRQLGEPEYVPDEAEEKRPLYKTRGFWMGKYPVTQAEWQAVMEKNPSYFVLSEERWVKKAGINDTSRFPVENVSWNDCQEFLKKLNDAAQIPPLMGKGQLVLPHEDEWEYACRGGLGNKQPYYFGNSLKGDLANCMGN